MPAGKLRLNTVPEKLWQYISVDFITKLLISRGYNSILVVCDRFLKMLHFIVMTEKIIAEGLMKLFVIRREYGQTWLGLGLAGHR